MQEPVSPLAGAPSATVLPVDGHRLVHDELGLLLYVQVGPAADDTLNAVRSLLRRHPEAHQLRGRSLRVDFGEHLLDTVAMRRLVVLLRMEYGVSVAGVRCSPGALQRFAEQVFQTRVRFSGGALEMAQFEGPMSSLDGLDPMIWAALLPAPTPEPVAEPVAMPEAPVLEAQVTVAVEVVGEVAPDATAADAPAADAPAADAPAADAPVAPQALVEADVQAAVVESSAPIAPVSPAPVPAQAAEATVKAGGKRGRRRGAKLGAAEPALSIPAMSIPAVAPSEVATAQEPTTPVAVGAAPAAAPETAAAGAELGSGVTDGKPVDAPPEAPVPLPGAGSPALAVAPAADPGGDAEDDQLELGEAEEGDGALDVGDAILAVTDLSVTDLNVAPSSAAVTAATATEAAEPRRLGEQQPAWHREGDRRVLAVSRTLRSGAIVRFPGDVVVYGDVNAGAHIEAGGNIIVLGALRGLAHAGAQGDTAAVVLGFDLKPAQLRIADHIAFPEGGGPARASGLLALFQRDRSAKGAFAPVVALVRDGHIVLEDYRGRLPG